MPFAENSGARIYYEVEGSTTAPCITLLNGYSRSSTDFRAMAKFLDERGYRVVRVDNRGAGKTENDPSFTVSEMVSDVVAVWDALEIKKSAVLGISYGGVLSLLLGNQFGDRLSALILVSTTPSSFFLSVDNDISAQPPEKVESSMAHYFSAGFAKDNPILYKSLLKETAKAFLNPASRERSAQQRAALKKFDFTPLLHSIRCPTLIVHGGEDGVISPEAAEVAHRAIKQSELEIVPGIGHLFLAEAPRILYERVCAFLDAHRE